MTEQQFIAKFKKDGLELYSTAGIQETYKELENLKTSFNRKCEELQDVRSQLYWTKEENNIANSRLDKVINTALNNSIPVIKEYSFGSGKVSNDCKMSA